MLWRALKHVDQGFYIDIGAWSPEIDSVTRAFYERGWSGINIEPNPVFHRQLAVARARDTCLQLAVSDATGRLSLAILGDTGLSTFDDNIARQHVDAGWVPTHCEVEVVTLASVHHQHVPAGQAIHFLKVDVEGFEAQVLRGNDWKACRPWVVVVEATLPLSQIESHGSWEPMLLQVDYQLAYADGLNRFYVALEHPELLAAFNYPPNVFDGFKLVGQQDAEERAAAFEAKWQQGQERVLAAETECRNVYRRIAAAEARAKLSTELAEVAKSRALEQQERVFDTELFTRQSKIDELGANSHLWWQRACGLESERNALRSSWSWRVTWPLRFVLGLVRHPLHTLRDGSAGFKRCVSLGFTRAASAAMAPVLRRPQLAIRVNRWLLHAPFLHRRLREAARSGGLVSGPAADSLDEGQGMLSHDWTKADLTPRGRQVYAELQTLIDLERRGGR